MQGQTSNPVVPSGLLPTLERSLDQIEGQTRKLLSQQLSTGSDSQAFYMLASRGFQPDRLEAQLNALPKLTRTFEPLHGAAETDVEGYLQHEQELSMLGLIEQVRTETTQRMDDELFEALHADWEQVKHRITKVKAFVVWPFSC